MNKLSFLTIVFISTIISCSAQKNQDRPVSPFSKLKISGSLHVIYTHSDTLSLSVQAKENEINNVVTKIENGTLYVSNKGIFNNPVNVYIKNNRLTDIESSGATDFKTTNLLRVDSLNISASGASIIRLKLEARAIRCNQSGASNLILSGTTDVLEAEISGAATLKSFNLAAKNANLVTTGAANARVYVTEKLNANAGGASDIKVKGDTKDINAETSSSASIKKIKDVSKAGEKSGNDTTSYNWNRKKILVIKGIEDIESEKVKDKGSFKHWQGISAGVNGYMNGAGAINIPKQYRYMDLNYTRSFNFQFNLFEHQFKIYKNYFKILTGFGIDYHQYELANKTNLNPDSSFTWGVIDSSNKFSYLKNRLRCTYLQVPLMFEFNTSNDPNKTFHIAFGVIGQYLVGSRTKQKLEEDKYKFTKVRKDAYNLSPFAAKAHVNFGYRGWTIFGEYSLTPLFQSGKGPELIPFTVGLRVIPFG